MSMWSRSRKLGPIEELKFTPLPEVKPPTGEELEYRLKLQEAVLFIAQKVLEERRSEILKRAKARLETEALIRK